MVHNNIDNCCFYLYGHVLLTRIQTNAKLISYLKVTRVRVSQSYVLVHHLLALGGQGAAVGHGQV